MSAQGKPETVPGPRRVPWAGTGMPPGNGNAAKPSRIIGQPALPDLGPVLLLGASGSHDPDACLAGFPEPCYPRSRFSNQR